MKLEELRQCDFRQDSCENILVVYKVAKHKVYALYTFSDDKFGNLAEVNSGNAH